MNIKEEVNNLENRLVLVNDELNKCKKLSGASFAFTANWRDKASFAKRIPILQKELVEINNKLLPLKLALAEKKLQQEQEETEKKLQEEKLEKEKQEKIAKENKIINPILTIDV